MQLLLDLDEKGRQIVQQAEQKRLETVAHMDDYKSQLAAQYHERLERRLDKIRADIEQEKQEQLQQLKAVHKANLQHLDAHFNKFADEWVGKIVSHCIGG